MGPKSRSCDCVWGFCTLNKGPGPWLRAHESHWAPNSLTKVNWKHKLAPWGLLPLHQILPNSNIGASSIPNHLMVLRLFIHGHRQSLNPSTTYNNKIFLACPSAIISMKRKPCRVQYQPLSFVMKCHVMPELIKWFVHVSALPWATPWHLILCMMGWVKCGDNFYKQEIENLFIFNSSFFYHLFFFLHIWLFGTFYTCCTPSMINPSAPSMVNPPSPVTPICNFISLQLYWPIDDTSKGNH